MCSTTAVHYKSEIPADRLVVSGALEVTVICRFNRRNVLFVPGNKTNEFIELLPLDHNAMNC